MLLRFGGLLQYNAMQSIHTFLNMIDQQSKRISEKNKRIHVVIDQKFELKNTLILIKKYRRNLRE